MQIKPTIQTYSGDYFNLLDPAASEIKVTDIARSLSRLCRYNGHCKRFYSVAEHSVHVSKLVPKGFAMQALFHDAAEAYIGDVPTPLKQLLPEYKKIETCIEAAIEQHFGFPGAEEGHFIIKEADLVMLATERDQLMPPNDPDNDWSLINGIDRAAIDLSAPMGPDEAYSFFLDRLTHLVEELA